jgi:hypothetical protein
MPAYYWRMAFDAHVPVLQEIAERFIDQVSSAPFCEKLIYVRLHPHKETQSAEVQKKYRHKSIAIACIADTCPVSLTVSPIHFTCSIDFGTGDMFKAKIWQYSLPIVF